MAEISRIERIRRMIEDDDEDRALFSQRLISHAPWDRLRKEIRPTENFTAFDKAFDDPQITVVEAHESGNTVVVRWRFRGTWKNELPGVRIRPNGQKIDITGVNTYRFVGDRIVEKTGQFDVGGFHADACEQVNPAECVEALRVIAPPRVRF